MGLKQKLHLLTSKFTIGNPIVFFAAIIVVIFGSLMVISAEMGNAVGDTQHLTSSIGKQTAYALIGILCLLICTNLNIQRFSINFYWAIYIVVLGLLIITRFFGEINGAYAWISIGSATIQPSEIAKAFMIAFGAKLLNETDENKLYENFKKYAIFSAVYFFVILAWQKDLGSAVVLAIICYCILLVPSGKKIRTAQFWMLVAIFVAVVGMAFALSPAFTNFLMEHDDNYMVGRFLASANPFLYQYDYGYHLIMSLASFATGGLFGLGYGNSIHKYMNFPNPSSDFILPVIVEETGFVGFSILISFYLVIMISLAVYTFRTDRIDSRIILLGTFLYFVVHFILNVGGVSGIIPLTGVPLLLVSSGGSSMAMSLAALGMSQHVIMRNKNAHNSRKIQKDTNQNS
ncbi:MAG: FtsW/RodA/SpoVE family cell cycle protein [Erysipelotrichaceae bacterium]|nr:FtsW/RodA/SpoVE family cell cycle protein [Erysipelotrichaceae bacterium]